MDIFITLQISLSKSLFLLDVVVVVVVVAVGEEDEGVKIKTKLSLLYRLTYFLVRTSSLPINRPKVGAKHLYVHCTLSYLTYHNLK